MSVVEVYFFEELSMLVGQQSATQWLESTVRHNIRKRSSALLSRELGSTGTSTPDSRTPESSCPPSPRCCVPLNARHDRPARKDPAQTKKNVSSDVRSSLCNHEMINPAVSSTKLARAKEHDRSMYGLLFTDAAHAVVDRLAT